MFSPPLFQIFYVRSANRRCITCYMIPRVPQCQSPRNGTQPTPSSASVSPLESKGGGHTHLRVKGLGVPIRRTGENAWHIILILILLARGTSERQYIGTGGPRCANLLAHWCPPPPIGNADQAQCANNIFFPVLSATPIGAGCIGAPIVFAEYKEDDCVWCASPIFIPIAYELSLTNRKWKYVAEKTTAPLKSKQTSITTVWCPILSVDRLPTPLIFRYPLPLKAPSGQIISPQDLNSRIALSWPYLAVGFRFILFDLDFLKWVENS